jgi:hypothetical protein
MGISEFRTRFAEQSKKLDDQLQFENQADQQIQNERWEKDARKTFVSDLKSIGQALSEAEVTALVQFMLEKQFDLRIAGTWTVAYVAANAEGLFEKMRADEAETQAAEEAASIKPATITDKAPSSVKIEGNKTVTSYRREGDEGIPADELEALRPENLTKSKMRELKLKAGQNRRDNMTAQAEQAMDRGERVR